MVRTSVSSGDEAASLSASAQSVSTGQLTVHRAADALWRQMRGKEIN
jgi:hypothetical protein